MALGRAIDSDAAGSFALAFDNGLSLAQAASAVLTSQESYLFRASNLFRTALGRGPDGFVAPFVGSFLEAGGTEADLLGQFLATPEFFARAPFLPQGTLGPASPFTPPNL